MPRLSFIVPVYNVAPYLRKCVESLLMQDCEDYEIILVNDGSTDECPQICDELAVTYENIRVIHQQNGGLSAARNTGLKVAKGEYICFVDSDDYWEGNVLGGLMAQVERENLDVLRFDYQNVRLKAYPQQCSTDGHRQSDRAKLFTRKGKGVNAGKMILGEYEVFEPNKTPRYIDRKDEIVDGETYLNTRMRYACYAVMFIVRHEIVPEFKVGIHFEDVDWLPRMMLRAKRVNSTQTIVYNYFVRQGSITQVQGNKEKIRKNLEDRMRIIETYSGYIKQHPTCKWLKNMQSSMVAGVLTTVAQSFYQEKKEYISRLKALNVFPLTIADQGRTYERRAKTINYSPIVFCAIMNLRKKIL